MTEKKRVVALGFFDGVHIGHGALMRRTAERAEELGVEPAVVDQIVILKHDSDFLAKITNLVRR